MSDIITVNMGELTVGKAPIVVETNGVGSCVAICLYSSFNHAGGLAHIMLPRSESGLVSGNFGYRYADIAIKVMLEQLSAIHVMKDHLIAKIAGGANMFPDVQGRSHKVGEKNIESVKEILAELGISLIAEHTGGTVGRSVTFDLGNGIVTIKSNI
jgi:chemotaxis protein CheD